MHIRKGLESFIPIADRIVRHGLTYITAKHPQSGHTLSALLLLLSR
jgi:hypothetical protein